MGMIGNTPYQGIIQSGNLQDGAVTTSKVADSALTAAKLAAAAVTDKLGYTPVNKAGDTLTGVLEGGGVARNVDNFRVGANNASTEYGFRIGTYGATDPLEIWREHSNGDLCVLSVNYHGHMSTPNNPSFHAVGCSYNGQYWNNKNIGNHVTGAGGHNVGSHFSPVASGGTGRFTAPVSGYYWFGSGVLWYGGTNTANRSLAFKRNGTICAESYGDSAGPNTNLTLACVLYLAAGEYVEAYASAGSANFYDNGATTNNYGSSNYNYFSGRLVG